jgi:thiazolylpeptide-type bacteriocin precursor
VPNNTTPLSSLAQEIFELESDTFEITDYEDAGEMLANSCMISTCSCIAPE